MSIRHWWFIPLLVWELILGAYVVGVASNVELIEWIPLCRHKALYWASVVRDQAFPVRFQFIKDWDEEVYLWHVQPQLKLGDRWHYFKVENEKIVIMNRQPNWEEAYIMYPEDYVDYVFNIQREEKIITYE